MDRGNSKARRDYVTTLAWIIGCAGPIVVVGASIEVGYLSGRGVARLLGDRQAARG